MNTTLFTNTRYFVSFAESILMKGQVVTDSAVLQQHVPDFLWLLRDVDVEFIDEDDKDEEREISPTEYVTKSVLKTKKANPSKEDIGEKILNLFPTLQCIAVSNPGQNPNNLGDDEPCDFNTEIEAAIKHVKLSLKPKTVRSGSVSVTGTSLAILAEEYMKALSSPDTFPDLEYSWMAVVEKQLLDSFESLVAEYKHRMSEVVRDKVPIEHASLIELHWQVLAAVQQLLIKKLESLLPRTNLTDLKLYETYSAKLASRVAKFMQDEKCIESGEIMQFIIENKNKSYLQCRQLSQTLKHSHMTLRNIISSYNENSIGPAKREVYEQEIAIIPGKPINARVVNTTSSTVTLTWNAPHIHASVVKEYHIQHCLDICYSKWSQSLSTTELSIEFTNLIPNSICRFRICSCNVPEKSDYAIVTTLTGPGQPTKPEPVVSFEVFDYHQFKIVCKAPKEEDGNGALIVGMFTELTSIIKNDIDECEVFEISRCEINKSYIGRLLYLPNIIINQKLHLLIFWVNSLGRLSLASNPLVIESTEFIPGPPGNVKKVGRTHNKIKICFDPPEINPGAVDHYQIEIERESNGSKMLVKNTKWLSAVLTNLSANTEYKIYVTSVNKKNLHISCSYLICRTKLSKVAAGFAGAGATAVGVAAVPVAGAAIVPLASAAALVDGIEERRVGKIVGGAVGLLIAPITAPLGFLGGLVTSPVGGLGGAVAAKLALMDSDDDIEDSDPEADDNSEIRNELSSSKSSIGSLFSEDFNEPENEPSSRMHKKSCKHTKWSLQNLNSDFKMKEAESRL